MAIFEISKNGIWSKKIREIDLFDFTSFFFGLDFFNYSDHNYECQCDFPKIALFSNFRISCALFQNAPKHWLTTASITMARSSGIISMMIMVSSSGMYNFTDENQYQDY